MASFGVLFVKLFLKEYFGKIFLFQRFALLPFLSALRADYLAQRSLDFKSTKYGLIWSYIRKVILKRIYLKKRKKTLTSVSLGGQGTHADTDARTDRQ